MNEVQKRTLLERIRTRPMAGLRPAPSDPAPAALKTRREVYWRGIFHNTSGYAKMNREMLFRAANTFQVQADDGFFPKGPPYTDLLSLQRVEAHKTIAVSPRAPSLLVYSPREETDARYRICFSMMETETFHPGFVALLNAHYDEFWTPSHWGAERARASGLRIPTIVIPLGVNPEVYRPLQGCSLPACELLTTKRAGTIEEPEGFLFLSVFLPSFRKGPDVLLAAFEEAFANRPDVALVIGTTTHPSSICRVELWRNGPSPEARRARVYAMTGCLSEEEMNSACNACHAYVSASRGEGFNLPLVEAASAGLPVVAPKAFAHLDFLSEGNSYLFQPDGFAPYPGSESVSPWYEGMPFPVYDRKARGKLAELMREVEGGYADAVERGACLAELIREKYTWDLTARRVTNRLSDIVES